MRTCKILLISLVSAIIMFFVSINFVFRVPSPTGGYVWLTYVVGIIVAVISGLVVALICEKTLPRTNKKILENKLNDLKHMLNNGTISQEEYEHKRQEIIDKF